jgi:hypothetical protein
MRFILNFILYGILFYLIYLIFPEAFFTLVSWLQGAAEFLKDLYSRLAGKVPNWRGHGQPGSHLHALSFQYMLLVISELFLLRIFRIHR